MSSDFLSDLDKWVMESIEKSAEEATRQGADSSHPSQTVEDGDKPATEGARSSENEADVKADVPGDNIDTAKGSDAEGPGRGENTPVLEMANAKATGEDPANETSSVKGKPEDPGTAHPAKATMGEKYSAAQLITMSDEILGDIAAIEVTEKKAEVEIEIEKKEDKEGEEGEKYCKTCGAESKEDCHCGEKEASAEELKQAEEAGRAAAASIVDAIQEKQASASVDQAAVIDSIVKNASADAQNVIEYLVMFKQAMGDMAPEEMAALADAAAAEAPAAAAPADAAIAEAVAAPEEAAMAEAGAGGDDVDALVDALVEAGVEPEELLALAGEGEAPVEEAAAPVEEAAVEAPVEDVVEEAEITEEPKEAAAKKAALKTALSKVAAKTA